MNRPHPIRRWPAIAAAALVCASLSACGSTLSSTNSADTSGSPAAAAPPAAKAVAPAASTSGVTLRIGDQAGTGAQALLDASGLIHQLPFTVKWSDFTSGPPMLQALSAGALDLGGVGDAPPVFAAAGGAKLAIVGALANNPNSAALVVPKGSSITSIKQLKGKRIAVAQGSSADYHLLTVLKQAGLSVHDVTLDYLQPAEALAALQSGSVDAWDIWAPFIQEATLQDGARTLVNGDGYGSNYSYEVASSAALANPNEVAAIDQYLKVLDEAHHWANTHVGQWAAVWAKATGLPGSTMDAAARDDTQQPVPVTSSTVQAEQALVNAFASAGLVPRSYGFARYATNAFNSSL